jgi:L-malate glycosyltransferase
MNPITVMHIDTERGWRGGERQVLWLAEALVRQGHRSVIAARPGEPLWERARTAGIEVVPCAPLGEADVLAAWKLRREIVARGVQVVHAHTGHAVALAALAVRGSDVRMVVTRRVDFRLRDNAGTRWKYRQAHAIIAISEAVARALRESGVDGDRITLVHSGVDLRRTLEPALPATLEEVGVPAGAPLVVQVGALVPHKDPVTFVRAIGVAARQVPGVRGLLVGDGELLADVEASIAEQDLYGVVLLAGYRRDADSLLAAADVATLSSREEGLGTVLLDAMAMSRPIAACAGGGIPEVVEDGVTGLLVPPGDSEALGDAIARILLDRELAGRLGRAGRERVESFSVDHTAELTARVYARVLGRV